MTACIIILDGLEKHHICEKLITLSDCGNTPVHGNLKRLVKSLFHIDSIFGDKNITDAVLMSLLPEAPTNPELTQYLQQYLQVGPLVNVVWQYAVGSQSDQMAIMVRSFRDVYGSLFEENSVVDVIRATIRAWNGKMNMELVEPLRLFLKIWQKPGVAMVLVFLLECEFRCEYYYHQILAIINAYLIVWRTIKH